MFTDDIVRALLAVGRQVAVGEVVAGQALVAGDPGAFENHEREARNPTMWTSLGAKPVAALTKLRKFDVRRCSSQFFRSSLTTIASIWATV